MSDLITPIYLQLVNSINGVSGTENVPSLKEAGDAGESTVSFQEILSEQVEELRELLQTEEEMSLGGLEDVLDKSILGNDRLDLNSLSEEMLYSSGGSSVLSQLMNGHFSSIVMETSESEEQSNFSRNWNHNEENREQQIEQLLTNIQNTIGKIGE